MKAWEQVVEDNKEAVWIVDGKMCEDYRNKWNRAEEPWKLEGFNGCWSCDRIRRCNRVRQNVR